MIPKIQLFKNDKLITAEGISDPSITLIECSEAFSVLISEGVEEKDRPYALHLQQVTHLRVKGKFWYYSDFQTVVLSHNENFWTVKDMLTGKWFPWPSVVPYHVIFIEQEEYKKLICNKFKPKAKPVFEFAQEKFGRLPGFKFQNNTLTVPKQYAQETTLERENSVVDEVLL